MLLIRIAAEKRLIVNIDTVFETPLIKTKGSFQVSKWKINP